MKPDWLVGISECTATWQHQVVPTKQRLLIAPCLKFSSLSHKAKQDLTVLVQKTHLEANQAIEEVQGPTQVCLAQENLHFVKAFTQ